MGGHAGRLGAMVKTGSGSPEARDQKAMEDDSAKNGPLVCLYEDRPSQVSGVKILIITLSVHCPTWPIRLHFPDVSPAFRSWLAGYPQVQLYETGFSSSGSYNVKPSVLSEGLASGAKQCLWIDNDVLVRGNLDFITALPEEEIVVSQDPWEYGDGSTHRCKTWGMKAGRSLPGPLNSSVVRVSQVHTELLSAWIDMVASPSYLAEQARPVSQRNPHQLGDQDALSALLASERFAEVPVYRLRHASEILQHHGAGAYGPLQRMSNVAHGMPPLIHAMGTVKPWMMKEQPKLFASPRDYYERAYLELSPYVHFARQYRSQIQEDAAWLDIHTLAGRLGTCAALNRPAMKGLLQASIHRALHHTAS
jgi:hypothetical protein